MNALSATKFFFSFFVIIIIGIIIYFSFFNCCSNKVVPTSPLIALLCLAQPPSQSHPVVRVCGSFTLVLSLVPSPSSLPYPLPPSPLVPVSLFLVSMPLFLLLCSFVCFVHQVLLISEIIWYSSFAAWLISLNLFFTLKWLILHYVNYASMRIHKIKDNYKNKKLSRKSF